MSEKERELYTVHCSSEDRKCPCIMEISGLYSNHYFGGAMEIEGGDHTVVMSVDSGAGWPVFQHLSC